MSFHEYFLESIDNVIRESPNISFENKPNSEVDLYFGNSKLATFAAVEPEPDFYTFF